MNNNKLVPVITIALIYGIVLVYNSLRRRSKLHRQGVVPPGLSAWNYLFRNGDDSSFLNITGFDRATFEMLHFLLYPQVVGAKRGSLTGVYVLHCTFADMNVDD